MLALNGGAAAWRASIRSENGAALNKTWRRKHRGAAGGGGGAAARQALHKQ